MNKNLTVNYLIQLNVEPSTSLPNSKKGYIIIGTEYLPLPLQY